MIKLFKLFFIVFLFNCKNKKQDDCGIYEQKVSFYMDKLTRAKQNDLYNSEHSKNSSIPKLQDSSYYYYKKMINCDSLNIGKINDFRSFLFLNGKREESIKYGEKILSSNKIDEYLKSQIRQSNFYTMITTDSIKYKTQINDYYIFMKQYPINRKLLESKNQDYINLVKNKILAIYYFQGYDSAVRLLQENNFDYKLTELWQSIEQFQPLDIYRRMYDFDRPEYYPMKDITKSKNYKLFYKNFVKYSESKNVK